MSLVDEPGEWEDRKITILGAVKSFIGQLTIGDDLTKISMPAEFLYPFSALEIAASRGLGWIHLLLRANREQDPLERMLSVVRYTISFVNKERLQKKPYNPILAETHCCYLDLSGNESEKGTEKDYGMCEFFAEQTLHHPPLSAFIIENKKENIRIHSNVVFSTQFHGNSVTIHPQGTMEIELRNFGEKYVFSSPLPDCGVKNVILGTRRASWEGEMVITCEKTGFSAQLTWKEEGWYCINVVTGAIFKGNTKLYSFYGPCYEVVTMTNSSTNQNELLLDATKLTRNKITYLPEDKWDDKSSLKLWKEVTKAIVANDLYTADIAKRVIEDSQRKRRTEGTTYTPQFFSLDQKSNTWVFNEDKLPEVDALINSSSVDDVTGGLNGMSLKSQ